MDSWAIQGMNKTWLSSLTGLSATTEATFSYGQE